MTYVIHDGKKYINVIRPFRIDDEYTKPRTSGSVDMADNNKHYYTLLPKQKTYLEGVLRFMIESGAAVYTRVSTLQQIEFHPDRIKTVLERGYYTDEEGDYINTLKEFFEDMPYYGYRPNEHR